MNPNFNRPEHSLEGDDSTLTHFGEKYQNQNRESARDSKDTKYLCDRHLKEWVEGSAVKGELAKRCLTSITGKDAIAKLLGWGGYQNSSDSGWYVRSVDVESGQIREFGQFKPDTPIQFPDKEKPQKYFSFPKGSESEPIFLPADINILFGVSDRTEVEVIETDLSDTKKDAGFWRWVLNHPEIPIAITEGAKKAGCLLTNGVVCIALTGVWNGQQKDEKGKRHLHPLLKPFVTPGRKISLVFDADSSTNKEVRRALKTLGLLCQEAGAAVKVADWAIELGKGIDDVTASKGKPILDAIMEESMPYDDWLENLEKQFKDETTARGDKEGIPDSFDPDVEFNQQALKHLFGDKPWICVNDKLYFWADNHYKLSPDVIEKRRIRNFCNGYAVIKKDDQITYPYAKPVYVEQVLNWVKISLGVDPGLVNPSGVNCTNGVLQIEWEGATPSWKLIDHTPQLYYLFEPLVQYKPDANPEWCDKVLSSLDSPEQDIFLKTIGASLDLDTVRKWRGRLVKSLLLQGTGNNGKDTLRECVSRLYGGQGMTGATTSDFAAYDNGRKFPLAKLIHSRVNWASENSDVHALDKLQSLKRFVTGDPLDAERKGIDEVEFTPRAVSLFNINDNPNLAASQEAIQSRYAILSFLKKFVIGADASKGEIEAIPQFKYDPGFLEREVLPAFLNKVLDGLKRLMSEGIDYRCTNTKLRETQAANNHLYEFCQNTGFGYQRESVTYVTDIWQQLRAWYISTGTLEVETVELSNGTKREKLTWHEQANKRDRNVKAANQVAATFLRLFPDAKKGRNERGNFLSGVGFSGEMLQSCSNPVAIPVAVNHTQQASCSTVAISAEIDSENEIEKIIADLSHLISSHAHAREKILAALGVELPTDEKSKSISPKTATVLQTPCTASDTATATATGLQQDCYSPAFEVGDHVEHIETGYQATVVEADRSDNTYLIEGEKIGGWNPEAELRKIDGGGDDGGEAAPTNPPAPPQPKEETPARVKAIWEYESERQEIELVSLDISPRGNVMAVNSQGAFYPLPANEILVASGKKWQRLVSGLAVGDRVYLDGQHPVILDSRTASGKWLCRWNFALDSQREAAKVERGTKFCPTSYPETRLFKNPK